jgi:hypothetical protein
MQLGPLSSLRMVLTLNGESLRVKLHLRRLFDPPEASSAQTVRTTRPAAFDGGAGRRPHEKHQKAFLWPTLCAEHGIRLAMARR